MYFIHFTDSEYLYIRQFLITLSYRAEFTALQLLGLKRPNTYSFLFIILTVALSFVQKSLIRLSEFNESYWSL